MKTTALRFVWFGVALLLLTAFVVFVWPTRYMYREVPDNSFLLMRIDRWSGNMTIIGPSNQSKEMSPEELDLDRQTRLLANAELAQLRLEDQDIEFVAGGKLTMKIYNGTPRTIDAVRISVGPMGLHGISEPITSQGWRSITIEPFHWGDLSTTISNAPAPDPADRVVTLGVSRIDAASHTASSR